MPQGATTGIQERQEIGFVKGAAAGCSYCGGGGGGACASSTVSYALRDCIPHAVCGSLPSTLSDSLLHAVRDSLPHRLRDGLPGTVFSRLRDAHLHGIRVAILDAMPAISNVESSRR